MGTISSSAKLTHLDRLCFVHIPKTAGTSLRLWLEDLFDVAACCPYYHPYEFSNCNPDELANYQFFSGHFGWEFAKSLSPSCAITFLRDPADRTLSALRYLRTFTTEQDRMYRDRTWVKGWVLDLLNSTSNEKIVAMPRFANEGNEQTRQLSDLSSAIVGFGNLQTAIGNLNALIAFGLVEDMERSVLLLSDALGLPARTMTLRANVTRRDASPEAENRELAAAQAANAYDIELYREAKREFDARWLHLMARHDLEGEPSERSILIERINQRFRSTERGVPYLSELRIDPSLGAAADGWKERFFYDPIQRWVRWSRTHRPCLWLPIDRRKDRGLRVEIAYTTDSFVRDAVTIEIDGLPVQTDRHYEIWPEDQSYHLVLHATIPRCNLPLQYTEVALRIPMAACERSSIAASRIEVFANRRL